MLLLVSEMPRLDEPLPPALLALFDTPTKLMAPPVIADVPASPRNMMPMAKSSAEPTDSPRTVTAPVPALRAALNKATPPE